VRKVSKRAQRCAVAEDRKEGAVTMTGAEGGTSSLQKKNSVGEGKRLNRKVPISTMVRGSRGEHSERWKKTAVEKIFKGEHSQAETLRDGLRKGLEGIYLKKKSVKGESGQGRTTSGERAAERVFKGGSNKK